MRNGRRWQALAVHVAVGCLAVLALTGNRPARAEEHLQLVNKINVGGQGVGIFDISFVNPTVNLYVLADRTNAAVDFVDTITNSFLFRVPGFKGVVTVNGKVDNSLSGPDGVAFSSNTEVWAGDGDSTIKVIDLVSRKIVDVISTGGTHRVDEMAYDQRDHLLAAANNADTPPFVTIFDTSTRQIVSKIMFDGTNNTPNALGGIEQSKWSAQTGLFYVSVPQVGSDPTVGGVSVIDPHSMKVLGTFLLNDCGPTGLALGPRHQAFVGCGSTFGTAPNVISQTYAIDIVNGDVVADLKGIGGEDEIWYDPGTNHYYLPAHANLAPDGTANPLLAVVDGGTNAVDSTLPLSTTSHSVAGERTNGYVFVPVGVLPTTPDPNNICPTKGCIAVYKPVGSALSQMAQTGH